MRFVKPNARPEPIRGGRSRAQASAIEKAMGLMWELECGHYTDRNEQLTWELWCPGKNKYHCDVCHKWLKAKKIEKTVYPDEPLF